jgi:hypothetical protein
MATAEIFRDVSMAATANAVPMVGDAIQGSTQEYGVTRGSQQAPAPIFFAPPHQGKLATYWGSMLHGVVRTFYAFVPGGNPISPACALGSRSFFAWDRLSLDLMRIASLERNWDGEGAEPVPRDATTNAVVLLFLARAAMEQSKTAHCPVPIVIPAVDGGVILKWVQGGRELKCTVRGDIIEVVRWRSPNGYESDGFWEIPVDRVVEHFEWLLQQ